MARELLSDADVERGLREKCVVCKAKPGVGCVSLCDGKPLHGRPIHIGRVVMQ